MDQHHTVATSTQDALGIRLLSAAQAIRGRIGVTNSSEDAAALEADIANAIERVSETVVTREWAAGAMMAVDEAVDAALRIEVDTSLMHAVEQQ